MIDVPLQQKFEAISLDSKHNDKSFRGIKRDLAYQFYKLIEDPIIINLLWSHMKFHSYLTVDKLFHIPVKWNWSKAWAFTKNQDVLRTLNIAPRKNLTVLAQID